MTGVNVKAQVEAFEEAFRRMDADGTNSVSLEEFETFFAAAGVKEKRPRKKPVARKKLGFGSPPSAGVITGERASPSGGARGSRRRLTASESAPLLGRNRRAGARLPPASPTGVITRERTGPGAAAPGRALPQQIPWRKVLGVGIRGRY